MLRSGPEESRPSDGDAARSGSLAIVPLAMPILVGPGAMATVIIQTHKLPGIADGFAISAICVAAALLVWACLRAAAPMYRVLGADGVSVLTRVMGLLLSSVAIGMIATGIRALFPGLG